MTGHADGAETNKTGIDPYDRNAAALAEMYESAMFETVHEAVRNLLFDSPVAVLDVGAGSGWDASWFAERGHDVVAVEPVAGLREEARGRHVSSRIRWMDDALPELRKVRASGAEFDWCG